MIPQVTITLTRYAEPDALVADVIAHACAQQGISGEVLFIEQQEDSALREAQFAGGNLELRIIRGKLGGLSHARNLALDQARYPLVLFLDADALADPDWAAQLVAAMQCGNHAIAACRIRPGWPGREPVYARATAIRDQYSLLELGSETFPYHRVVGAAFGVDMQRLPADLRFDTGLGRRDGKLFGGEESDFCRRAQAAGGTIVYAGSASVVHVVPEERTRLGWVIRRLFYAGHGRAMLGGTPAPTRKTTLADWLLLPLILPPYALGWIKGKLASDRDNGRSAAG